MRLTAHRTWWMMSVGLFFIALASWGYLVFREPSLEARLSLIQVGMNQTQVETILGGSQLTLPRATRPGSLRVWTDQFWQVDILFDGNNQVESVRQQPANSATRRLLSWF